MPGQQAIEQPNEFAAEFFPSTASTAEGGLFGFQASHIRVINDKASPVYVSLKSTVGSTGGFKTCSGETVVFSDIGCSGLAIVSTATSTGAPGVRVGAWGI